MVHKTSGDWRPCGDCRALNNAAIPYRYPVPHPQDFDGAPFDKAVFSKIDLVRAFHQIPVAPEDIPKTAVTTPFGLFEFIRVFFGLRNAAQTFQRFIDHVICGLPFGYAYIDDLLVASQNAEEHKGGLPWCLNAWTISALSSIPLKAEKIPDFPLPTSKRQLQRFLGMIDFYCLFLPNGADLMLPLINMLSGPEGTLDLTGERLTVFERIENSLAGATMSRIPLPKLNCP
nr:unnamed protein product [Spirometra erinaceieuropaei]